RPENCPDPLNARSTARLACERGQRQRVGKIFRTTSTRQRSDVAGKYSRPWTLIKPFVFRIELRIDDDQDFHVAEGAVAGAGADHDAGARLDGSNFVVQLHAGIEAAFEKVIGLG